jgi:histidinol-phosphate/aromatic aminotransferase/cobyric acid decarboxylase-like protein
VLTAFADDIDSLFIEDPANPTGNDLTDTIRAELSKIARNTLDAVDEHGWEHVFGKVEARNAVPRVQILRSAAAAVAVPTRPWASAD